MKTTIKKITPLILLACGAIIVFGGSFLKTPSRSNISSCSKQHILQELAREERMVNDALASIGATQEKREQARKKYYKEYLKSEKHACDTKPISRKTVDSVRTIARDLGLNIHNIKILGFEDTSPAAATQTIIYINEQCFSELSEMSKRFVIGHEIQHILHQDNFERYILENLCNEGIENIQHDHNHPLCQFSRFKERRADIKTALHSDTMAQAYLEFTKERLKSGDSRGITHPKNSDRWKLADRIASIQPAYNVA
jgi:Peptidase family M48